MVFIGILSSRQEKIGSFFVTFLLSRIFSRSASRHSLTKNSAKINFTVNDAVLRKLYCEENLSFKTFALSPLGAADCIGVKS